MDLDALFRMPMTRRPGDGGLRPFACGPGPGSPPSERRNAERRGVCMAIGQLAGR